MRHLAGDKYEVYSAGLNSVGVHTLTHKVMAEIGIDTASQTSKEVGVYLGKIGFNHVVFVCDKAERDCPHVFPFSTDRISWPIEDPKLGVGTDEEKVARFRAVRDILFRTITNWIEELEREAALRR